MRAAANKQLGMPVERRKGYKRIAHILVIASLLVWIPYYALQLSGQSVALTPFLTIHLVGIFSGTGLMGIGGVVQYVKGIRIKNEGLDSGHSESKSRKCN